jgi:hypothetical protein
MRVRGLDQAPGNFPVGLNRPRQCECPNNHRDHQGDPGSYPGHGDQEQTANVVRSLTLRKSMCSSHDTTLFCMHYFTHFSEKPKTAE